MKSPGEAASGADVAIHSALHELVHSSKGTSLPLSMKQILVGDIEWITATTTLIRSTLT